MACPATRNPAGWLEVTYHEGSSLSPWGKPRSLPSDLDVHTTDKGVSRSLETPLLHASELVGLSQILDLRHRRAPLGGAMILHYHRAHAQRPHRAPLGGAHDSAPPTRPQRSATAELCSVGAIQDVGKPNGEAPAEPGSRTFDPAWHSRLATSQMMGKEVRSGTLTGCLKRIDKHRYYQSKY